MVNQLSGLDASASFYLEADSGSCNVGVVDNISLNDDRRERELPLRIYYPQEKGLFPVIIFSHGSGGSKESFAYLGQFWATHGYICIHPTHVGSDASVLQKVGLQALLEINSDPEVWSERPQDVSFLIDSLKELEQQVPQLAGKISSAFIGVAGHSFGAYATMLLAGTTVAMPGDETASFRDDRIGAFLVMSPPGTGRQGLNMESWQSIDMPMMTVSGSEDQGAEWKPPSWRMEAFKYMPPGDKYHVLVAGANHFSFDPDMSLGKTGFARMNSRKNPARARAMLELESTKSMKSYLQSTSIAFWDAYLKFQKSAKDYLNSDALQVSSQGDVLIYSK